jgi:hypothetical protein
VLDARDRDKKRPFVRIAQRERRARQQRESGQGAEVKNDRCSDRGAVTP